ncbi:MAG: LacI family DNA-binding transcriptional regulator [Verrucomicrobia bacterium]|nr:LacI family DNA-binding transcriptional regulator [Verrucomicrobiota bacterium]
MIESLRRSIVSGAYQPGHRIPIQTALAKRFRVSGVTLQRVLDRLVEEGFLRTRGRSGTEVVEHPPHLSHYALLFPFDPASTPLWSRFYTALVNEAINVEQQAPRRIFPFYGIDFPVDTRDYHLAVELARDHRIAGLIFASSPHNLVESPLMQQADIPRVAIMNCPAFPKVPAVVFEGRSFIEKALDYLRRRGRRRVAVITMPRAFDLTEENFAAAARRAGLETKPHWRLLLSAWAAEGAHNCVRLLMDAGTDRRPDGLIVGDDNLVEHVVSGLMTDRLRIGKDLDVVAHCNFPWAGSSALPLKRLGYDARQALEACFALVDCQRQGRKPPPEIKLPALFEDELPTRTPPPWPLPAPTYREQALRAKIK